MDELTARLEALLSRYATANGHDNCGGREAWNQFAKELRLLIAEYGPVAVDAALDKIPNGAGRAISIH
jgi:hypothetical protein